MYFSEYTSGFSRPAASHLAAPPPPRHEGNVGQAPSILEHRVRANHSMGTRHRHRGVRQIDNSPSPECSAWKSGDEWRGAPSEALAKEGYGEFRIPTRMPRGGAGGALLFRAIAHAAAVKKGQFNFTGGQFSGEVGA
jgi:hypothetical protein